MKMDMDLIRKLLIWCEDKIPDENQVFSTDDIEIEGYTKFQILHHIDLLVGKGYLLVIDGSTLREGFFFLKSLTFDGHEFLGIIRSDTTWNKLKEPLGKVGLAAFPVIVNIIAPHIRQLLGLP